MINKEEILALIEREGDKKEFEIDGIKCSILRHPSLKTLCGYIDLTEDFPEYGTDPDVYCHGGLNFTKQNGKYWRIGFDCGHAGDIVPQMLELEKLTVVSFDMFDNHETYKDMVFVEDEIRHIIEQLDTTNHDLRRSREEKLKSLDGE